MARFLFGALFIAIGELIFVNQINFAAEQWFDAVFFGLFEEARQSVEHPVVGDGEGFHAEFGGARHSRSTREHPSSRL